MIKLDIIYHAYHLYSSTYLVLNLQFFFFLKIQDILVLLLNVFLNRILIKNNHYSYLP
jgi:hypothetical protein